MNKESEKSVQKKWSTGKCHFRCARSPKRTSKIVPRQGCGNVKKSASKTEHLYFSKIWCFRGLGQKFAFTRVRLGEQE